MTDSRLVAVTGATGFIGATLTSTLRDSGRAVRTLSRTPGAADVTGDLTDAAAVASLVRGAGTIFHLAALAHDRRSSVADAHDRVGREGTEALLKAADAAGVGTIVFVSSLAVYGASFGGRLDESAPTEPDSPYGRSKLAAERLIHAWGSLPERRAIIVRPAMVYGAGAKGNLPRMISAIGRGVCPPIPVTSARRSLIHVQSLVELLLALEHHQASAGRVFNAADPDALSVGEMYEALMAGFGRTPPRLRVPLAVFRAGALLGGVLERVAGRSPFTPRAYTTLFGAAEVDPSLAETLCGYRSPRNFRQAVPELIAPFRLN